MWLQNIALKLYMDSLGAQTLELQFTTFGYSNTGTRISVDTVYPVHTQYCTVIAGQEIVKALKR
jgi:hypothetical protein